eukprot:CAMPEP_0204623720 /NCGR_PEP_ID=MMETSP0717-20131115/9484_1 /ASSEMBLY_ACC=CAM_ASM_000666 /TAXON_ID=230516 /ORGANISM="Chaetoceros curvisetus" /LENGTH=243 /DNA_ID=CAMNT_0051638893 /DNA_START=105 /DNA_END=836 /DNA_ORIENTATION=-
MNAMTSLNGLSVEYCNSDNEGGGGSGVGKLVSGFFGKVSGLASSNSMQSGAMSIVDSVRGPALKIECETEPQVQEGDGNTPVPTTDKQTHSFPLKRMGIVSASNDSSILSSSNSSTGISISRKKKNKHDPDQILCQFNLSALAGEDRDDIMEQIRILIQWDVDRRLKDPNAAEEEDNDDNDEEEKERNRRGLGSRALKMKHFAEREIELSKQKRDREARKARYLKDAGGLKYTAVAMANREMS